ASGRRRDLGGLALRRGQVGLRAVCETGHGRLAEAAAAAREVLGRRRERVSGIDVVKGIGRLRRDRRSRVLVRRRGSLWRGLGHGLGLVCGLGVCRGICRVGGLFGGAGGRLGRVGGLRRSGGPVRRVGGLIAGGLVG